MSARFFACMQCGISFQVEADVWMPGIAGTIVKSDGTVVKYDDPTRTERYCPLCAKGYIETLKIN